MKPLVIAVGLVLLMGADTAQGTTLPAEPFQTWTNEAKVPTPRGSVGLIFDLESWERGEAALQAGAIHWYADPTIAERWPSARPLFYHELGHIFDWTTLGVRKRIALVDLFPGWWRAEGSFVEQFAMMYSYCALGAYPYPGWDGYGYAPPAWKHRRGCKILRSRMATGPSA